MEEFSDCGVAGKVVWRVVCVEFLSGCIYAFVVGDVGIE